MEVFVSSFDCSDVEEELDDCQEQLNDCQGERDYSEMEIDNCLDDLDECREEKELLEKRIKIVDHAHSILTDHEETAKVIGIVVEKLKIATYGDREEVEKEIGG